MSHVLEHFADAAVVISALLRSCERLGIERVVVVVPGLRGYRSDATHKTFIDLAYIDRNRLRRVGAFRLAKSATSRSTRRESVATSFSTK